MTHLWNILMWRWCKDDEEESIHVCAASIGEAIDCMQLLIDGAFDDEIKELTVTVVDPNDRFVVTVDDCHLGEQWIPATAMRQEIGDGLIRLSCDVATWCEHIEEAGLDPWILRSPFHR